MECVAAPGNPTDARVGISLDQIDVSSVPHRLRFPCNISWTNFALVRTFPVSAGAHFLHLVAARAGGTGRVYFHSRTIQVLFVDQDGMGGS